MRGKFVSIEGIDKCGKSTHAKLLAGWLRSQGYDVVITDEPTDSVVGKIIKQILRGELKVPIGIEALLFAADRVQHVVNLINPALQEGKVVISERYIHSSLAYQSARGLSMSWIKKINKYAPEPDLTILIDVPTKAAVSRARPSRKLDEFEKDMALQERVRRNYLHIARQEGLKIVDGSRPRDEVQADLRKLVSALL
jgi:dTMP kinase